MGTLSFEQTNPQKILQSAIQKNSHLPVHKFSHLPVQTFPHEPCVPTSPISLLIKYSMKKPPFLINLIHIIIPFSLHLCPKLANTLILYIKLKYCKTHFLFCPFSLSLITLRQASIGVSSALDIYSGTVPNSSTQDPSSFIT